MNIPFAMGTLSYVAWFVLVGSTWQAATIFAADTRPNILFVFTDDHATQAIGAYGSTMNETPNIDRLAREGMLFRRCLVTNSLCGPSRAVILTGKYSHLNGFLHNGYRFNGAQQTFPRLLQQAGYQTALIGKWHLETDPTGFDHWEILIGQGPYYNPPMIRNGERVEHEGYTTDIITDLTLNWLEEGRDKTKPFMLMFQHKAPHREWSPGPKQLKDYTDRPIPEPETLFDDYEGRASGAQKQEMTIARHMSMDYDLKVDWAPSNLTPEQRKMFLTAFRAENEKFKAANLQGDELTRWKYRRYLNIYLRCIDSVDENLGRVLEYLDTNDLANNTIVMYASDQGFYLGEHGWYDKRWMYDESLRTPLVVRWPGTVKPGVENADLVSNLDFASTFLEMAGVEIPDDLQGRSLVPILQGDTPDDWRDAFYYHFYESHDSHSVARHYGITTKKYKLMHYYETCEWELFDLERDPTEVKNVYHQDDYSNIRRDLLRRLRELQKQYHDDDPTAPLPQQTNRRPQEKATPRL